MSILRRITPVLFAAALVTPVLAAPPADFTLEPATEGGKPFVLSAAKGHLVALHFLLETECPYCLRTTREYSTRGPEVAGVEHVFIKPDSPEMIKSWADKLEGNGPTIHRDPDGALADAFGIPKDFAFHGITTHYPALIVLDAKGKEIFRHIGKDNTDRVAFDDFAKMVTEKTRATAIGEYNLPKKGTLAIDGYDPVAYFVDGTAREGNKAFESTYRGVTYRFASKDHRATFAAAPEKYAPTYGGWCATAMAEGDKVEIDPENFEVHNGRLFLFYKGLLGDAKKDWVKNRPTSEPAADGHWKTIAGE